MKIHIQCRQHDSAVVPINAEAYKELLVPADEHGMPPYEIDVQPLGSFRCVAAEALFVQFEEDRSSMENPSHCTNTWYLVTESEATLPPA